MKQLYLLAIALVLGLIATPSLSATEDTTGQVQLPLARLLVQFVGGGQPRDTASDYGDSASTIF